MFRCRMISRLSLLARIPWLRVFLELSLFSDRNSLPVLEARSDGQASASARDDRNARWRKIGFHGQVLSMMKVAWLGAFGTLRQV